VGQGLGVLLSTPQWPSNCDLQGPYQSLDDPKAVVVARPAPGLVLWNLRRSLWATTAQVVRAQLRAAVAAMSRHDFVEVEERVVDGDLSRYPIDSSHTSHHVRYDGCLCRYCRCKVCSGRWSSRAREKTLRFGPGRRFQGWNNSRCLRLSCGLLRAKMWTDVPCHSAFHARSWRPMMSGRMKSHEVESGAPMHARPHLENFTSRPPGDIMTTNRSCISIFGHLTNIYNINM